MAGQSAAIPLSGKGLATANPGTFQAWHLTIGKVASDPYVKDLQGVSSR